jgi:hypothetical protein
VELLLAALWAWRKTAAQFGKQAKTEVYTVLKVADEQPEVEEDAEETEQKEGEPPAKKVFLKKDFSFFLLSASQR